MEIFKFDEVLEQLGSGDISGCSCHKKKKKKNKGMKNMKWSSELMSEKCIPCIKKKKKKKIKEEDFIVERCGMCGGLKKKKKKNKFVENFIKEEISPDLFKRTIDASYERGFHDRTYDFGKTFFREFIGKPLLGGEIVDIGTYMDNKDYPVVHIAIKFDDNYFLERNIRSRNLYYAIKTDSYDNSIEKEEAIDRKDSVLLSKIALKVNPDTKYKETGKNFKIKGW